MKSRFRILLNFPLTKIVLGILFVLTFTISAQLLAENGLEQTGIDFQLSRLLVGTITSTVALIAYILLFRWYEKRKITELSGDGILFNLGAGFFLGALLQSLTIFVIWANGGFHIVKMNPVVYLIPPFIMAFTSAIIEEVIVRGIIFRILQEKLGTYFALAISALIFGGLHLANPNSTLLAAFGLALQAGVFLAAAFVYSKNLWFPIAIHFAWNFTQGGIYGANVSGGTTSKSLFTTSITGNTWITGGDFGPEGSIQATVFCLAAAGFLLYKSHKKKLILPRPGKTTTQKKETV